MSTRRTQSPPVQYNIEGKRHSNDYTEAQHGVVAGRRADKVDRPFPDKPVSHRRSLNPRTQDPLDLCDFEKITIKEQPKRPLLLLEHRSNGIGETSGFRHPRKVSHGMPREEMQMTRAIHEKELLLQEKLWRVGEKVRQKIQRDSIDAPRGDGHKADRGNAQIKPRLMQDGRQEDVYQISQRKHVKSEDTLRNTHEEERARWKRREAAEVAHSSQSHRRGTKGTHEITVHEQEGSGGLNKTRWEHVKESTRRQGGGERDYGMWGETGEKSEYGNEKAKEREQKTTSMGDKGLKRDKKYRERTREEVNCPEDERDMPQQANSYGEATENHRGTRQKLRGEPVLSHGSSPLHGRGSEEQGEGGLTDPGLQLLPCKICDRKFASKRLEKHVQICQKVKESNRQVFNSYGNRTKGSAIEQFWNTHSRPKSPEVPKKKNLRQDKANAKNLHEDRLPAGTSTTKRYK